MGALYDQPFSLELLIDHLKGGQWKKARGRTNDLRSREGEVDPWYNSVNDQEGLRSLRARIALLRSIEGNSSLGLRECVTNALLR